MVFSEIEPQAYAILAHFQVQDQAIFDLLTGVAEPSAPLPMQMPADMQTVEEQFEDVPHDMKIYTDTQGNRYDFGFGLNCNGIINDNRVKKIQKIKVALRTTFRGGGNPFTPGYAPTRPLTQGY